LPPQIAELINVSDTGCWLWHGPTIRNGYGRVPGGRTVLSQYGPVPDQPLILAHRYTYEFFVGPFPAGLVSDHLCRVRNCANPEHIEPVTSRENTLRGQTNAAENVLKTHCLNGHPFSPENTRVNAKGHRWCRTCERARKKEWEKRNPTYHRDYKRRRRAMFLAEQDQ
jgi:hypothetical protein